MTHLLGLSNSMFLWPILFTGMVSVAWIASSRADLKSMARFYIISSSMDLRKFLSTRILTEGLLAFYSSWMLFY